MASQLAAFLCYPGPTPVLLPLLYIGFFFQVGAAAPSRGISELELRKQELGLIHFSVDRAALRALQIWDAKTATLRDARPGEVIDDSTPVMLLHLWATWCAPCKEEFPLWRKLGPRIVAQHRGRVRVAHVAVQDDGSDMASFVAQMRNRLPFPVQHFDREEKLAKHIRPRYLSKQLTLPTTLLLDGDRIVRQAFIGSITERQQELIDSTARLLDLIREQEDAALRPKLPETNDPFSVK